MSRGTLLSESWNACALPWKVVVRPVGNCSCCMACWIAVVAGAERHPLREVEADGDRRELPLMADGQWGDRSGRPFGEGADGHHSFETGERI